MRGAVLTGPMSVEIQTLPIPTPGPMEAVLAVKAATTCGTDVKVYRRGGHPRMLTVPTLFGHEVAGVVHTVGSAVTRLKVGDAIAVANSASCGQCRYCKMGRENLCSALEYLNGAFADYLLLPERFVVRATHALPNTLPFERAALAEPLACVLHGIDASEIDRRCVDDNDPVLVLGAGPIGLLFVAALAARNVAVILADPNPQRLDVGLLMGARQTATLSRDGNNAERLKRLTPDGRGAEVAIDCTGAPAIWQDAIASVRSGGLVNCFGGCAPGTTIALDTHHLHYEEITVKGVYHHRPETFRAALKLLAQPAFPANRLLNGTADVVDIEMALTAMIERRVLKMVIAPRPHQ